MLALFLISVFGILILWLAAIRPYCVANQKGHTTGANYSVIIWIDWQNAKEIARKKSDRGMALICYLFLLLHFPLAAGFIGALSAGL